MKRRSRAVQESFAPLPPRYLTASEAARYLGISTSTLQKHRQHGTGPAYFKLGGRVLYRIADLDTWAARGLRRATVQPGASVAPAAKA
jgi:excisionase family DNA binding protein